MATQSAKPKTAEQVVIALRGRQRALVEAYMRQLVPDYERHQDRLRDMREAGELTIGLLLRALSEHRVISSDELGFARSYLRRALLRGASEAELIRSARLWQRVVFDELEQLAGPRGSTIVAQLSRPLIDYVDQLSDAVAGAVEEIQAALRLTERDGRAELVEDLLAGRAIGADRSAALRACGLDDGSPILVVTARPTTALPDPSAGPVAAVALAHAAGDAIEPLFAVRGEETVIVRATTGDPQGLVDAIDIARCRLERDGVVLAVGISAIHDGAALAPAAYNEACLARESVAATGGLLAIALLDPLDYLFVRGADDTAWNLVAPGIRTFIEEDLGQAGLLVDTLDAYVACNLNVKQAAAKLFVHTNTAHYRMAKIEELTGRDLRNLSQLQELVIAVRLARRRTATPS